MKKEALRLQMLSGIISESVYKEKLEELGGGMSPKRIFRRAVVKKLNAIYDSVDNAELKLKLKNLMDPTIDSIVNGKYGDDIDKYPMADLLDDLDDYLKSVTQPLIDNYSSKDSIEVSDIEDSLNEGILTTLGGIALGAMAVKKAYDYVSNALLKRRMEETGEVKKGSNGVTMKQYRDKNSGEMFWGIQVIDKTKDEGYQSDNILLFKDSPERIEKILNSTIKWDTSDEAQMDDNYLDSFGQFKADKRMSIAENSDKQKIKISKKELAKIISEEIVRFKKKSLLENRLREIDEELKNL